MPAPDLASTAPRLFLQTEISVRRMPAKLAHGDLFSVGFFVAHGSKPAALALYPSKDLQ
ncbi:hypothetical protein AGR4A_Cc50264 [Agrobacterium tumefaciens str. B6]|uniref:Uncharacterized protein n=1 Tax=Agrobacterium tumefaciens str. B6 TaxID=1183423 RepID=A0A822V0T5_AGRTU|nr:hypothetical protein AGR4A_Cc50264 [Agrobacterium tumefaciens str. B6]